MGKAKIKTVEMVRTIRDTQTKELKNTSLKEQKKYFRKKGKLLQSKLTREIQETN